MNFLKKITGFIFYIPYSFAKRFENYKIEKFYKKNCVISLDSKIDKSARIKNFQNNKNKIIIGCETSISGELLIFKHGGEIHIGDFCFIGENTKIWSAEKITIGNRVLIAHNVNIHDQISHPLDSKERHEDYKLIFKYGLQDNVNLLEKAITIEDDVWIGFNATILKGVTIGNNSIVAAGSVVTKDIPANCLAGGNPARIIKENCNWEF